MEGELEAVNGEENMRILLIASPTDEQLGIPFTTEQFFWVFEKYNQAILLIIPILWSLVGTSAALIFGIKEDFGLFVAGTLRTAYIIWRDLTPRIER